MALPFKDKISFPGCFKTKYADNEKFNFAQLTSIDNSIGALNEFIERKKEIYCNS